MPLSSKEPPSRIAFLMGTLFMAAGLIVLIGSWGAYFTDSQIQHGGASALGQIEKKSYLFVTDGDSDYILAYAFVTQSGTKITATRHVSKSFWKAVSENQWVEIKYAFGNPKRNFPSGQGVTSVGMAIFASLFGVFFLLFGVGLIRGYIRSRRNN